MQVTHYIVLDLDLMPVRSRCKDPASTPSKVRAIHDLSYPEDTSANDNTVNDTSITVHYDGPPALAQRILHVEN